MQAEIARAEDREVAFRAVKTLLDAAPDTPEKHEAWRTANDRLGLTIQLRATGSATASAGRSVSRRLLDAGARLERSVLAAAIAHPALRPLLAELTPDHFDDELHRAIRAHVVDGHAARRRRASASTPSSTPRPRRKGSPTRPGRSFC